MHVGWDWATEAHDVTVVDDTGLVIDRWAPTHDEAGIAGTLHRLAALGAPARCTRPDRPTASRTARSVRRRAHWSTMSVIAGAWLLAITSDV